VRGAAAGAAAEEDAEASAGVRSGDAARLGGREDEAPQGMSCREGQTKCGGFSFGPERSSEAGDPRLD
jgi:hypothetical protein